MHRRAVVLAAVPALLISGFALATTSSARLVAAEPAGAVTTIHATSSGSAELVLYDDATLSPKQTGNPDVSISGGGRMVAFELRRADGGQDDVSGARLPSFLDRVVTVTGSVTPQSTCTSSDPLGLQSTCTNPTPRAIVLHEGYYHLVVLADGAPVTITLRLHGQQQRKATIKLQRTLRTLEANLPERESIGSSTITYGTDVPFTSATQAFTLTKARLHPKAELLAATTCARNDTGAPPAYAFSPACPGGGSVGYAWQIGGGSVPYAYEGVGWIGVPGSGGAPNGLGGSFVDSDGPTYLGGLGVWMAGDELFFIGGEFEPIDG